MVRGAVSTLLPARLPREINLLLLANSTYPLLTSSQCAIVNELPCRDSSSI